MNTETVIVRLRYWLIEALAGDMPVVINMVVARPKGFEGSLVRFINPHLPGLFTKNVLLGESREEILSPKRDTWTPSVKLSDGSGSLQEHRFIDNSLVDYDLMCGHTNTGSVPYLIARNQMIKCPACGRGANFTDSNTQLGSGGRYARHDEERTGTAKNKVHKKV